MICREQNVRGQGPHAGQCLAAIARRLARAGWTKTGIRTPRRFGGMGMIAGRLVTPVPINQR